jgi:hypothetical protein
MGCRQTICKVITHRKNTAGMKSVKVCTYEKDGTGKGQTELLIRTWTDSPALYCDVPARKEDDLDSDCTFLGSYPSKEYQRSEWKALQAHFTGWTSLMWKKSDRRWSLQIVFPLLKTNRRFIAVGIQQARKGAADSFDNIDLFGRVSTRGSGPQLKVQ